MEENGTKTKVRPRAQDCPATRTQAIISEDHEHAAGATPPRSTHGQSRLHQPHEVSPGLKNYGRHAENQFASK